MKMALIYMRLDLIDEFLCVIIFQPCETTKIDPSFTAFLDTYICKKFDIMMHRFLSIVLGLLFIGKF